MTIVVMALMNLQNTANLKAGRASVTCSLATTEIAFQEFTFAVSFYNLLRNSNYQKFSLK